MAMVKMITKGYSLGMGWYKDHSSKRELLFKMSCMQAWAGLKGQLCLYSLRFFFKSIQLENIML